MANDEGDLRGSYVAEEYSLKEMKILSVTPMKDYPGFVEVRAIVGHGSDALFIRYTVSSNFVRRCMERKPIKKMS